MTLTPLNASGSFDNALVNSVVNNPAVANTLLAELLAVMKNKGYGGLNIDFEYIRAEDRDAFTAFVTRCTELMHSAG